MRVLIVTAGSRGDVAPFTGLGQQLQRAGHDVALAAYDTFAELITGCGLQHRSVPGDAVEMVRARTAATSPEAAQEMFRAVLIELGEGILAAAEGGADVVLTPHGPAALSRIVADGLGIPSIGTYLFPSVPTRAFPLPGAPDPGGRGPRDNLAAGEQALAHAAPVYAPAIARLRNRLGLPAATGTPDISPPPGWPIYHGYSTTVLPRPDDWPECVHVTGYWWPATPTAWQPPPELVEFLDAGPPPVFIGFGSMTPDQAGRLGDIAAAVAARIGVRVLVQSGWADLNASGGDVHTVGDVPHEWLFPRMAATVHHAGAGTTGAGLRAGVPVVAVPMLIDQPMWAARLHHLGVAPPPLPLADLTADTLTAALRACLSEPAYRRRATAISQRITAEDGVGPVLAQLTH